MVLSILPPDFGSAILWLTGGAYTVKSIIRLMYLFVLNLNKHGAQTGHWQNTNKMTSEFAVISAFILSLSSVNASWESARNFTLKTAREVQIQCNQLICPDKVEGWEKYSDGTNVVFVGKCAKYRLTYIPSEELDNYRLVLRRDIDRDFIVRGGRNTRITSEIRY